MGKKGSWLSSIKKVFTPHCREKLSNVHEPERKSGKDKRKKGFGKLRHGEPSSIEKILGEAERDHNLAFKPPPPQVDSPKAEPSRLDSPRPHSPKSPSQREASSRVEPPRPPSPKPPSPREVSPRPVEQRENVNRPEHTLIVQHASATKIQGAFKGYMARRSFRALKGFVSPVRSQSQPMRDYKQTPTRLSLSPLSQSRSRPFTPSRPIRTRYSRGSIRGQESPPFKDDGSLISCPPYPSYMAPTVSAKAKVRPRSNPKERVICTTPSSNNNEKRRMSYPTTQQGQHDMFRWNKGSLLISNSSGYNKSPGSVGGVVLEKRKTVKSVGNLSTDSTVSMSRKPFNRFV